MLLLASLFFLLKYTAIGKATRSHTRGHASPIGRLISMVELGKLLLTQQPSLYIHMLITSAPSKFTCSSLLYTETFHIYSHAHHFCTQQPYCWIGRNETCFANKRSGWRVCKFSRGSRSELEGRWSQRKVSWFGSELLLWKMQPRLHWGRSGPCMWLVYECVFLKKINFFLFLLKFNIIYI